MQLSAIAAYRAGARRDDVRRLLSDHVGLPPEAPEIGAEGEEETMRFNPFLIKSEGWRRFSIAAGCAALVAWIIFIAAAVYDAYKAARAGFHPNSSYVGAIPVYEDKALEIILIGVAFTILAYLAIMIILHTTLWVVRGFRNFKN